MTFHTRVPFSFVLSAVLGSLLLLLATALPLNAQPMAPDVPLDVSVSVDPTPRIWKRDFSDGDIEQGESFEIEIEVENTGSSAINYGTIAISFPELDRSGDDIAVRELSSTSSREYAVIEAGGTIYNRSGQQTSADYLLVDFGGTTWTAGERKRIRIRVTPSKGSGFETGSFPVYWRATIDDQSFPEPYRSNGTDQQGWPIKKRTVNVSPPPGDLRLRLSNISGGSSEVPRSNGEIALYDQNGSLVDRKTTTRAYDGDGAGEVTFRDLAPDQEYRAVGYHEPDDAPFGSREFWVEKRGITVQSGRTSTYTLERDKPYLSSLRIFQDGRDVTSGTVTVGERVSIEVEVTNPRAGSNEDVRARLALDRNGRSPYDFDETERYEYVRDGDTETYRFSWTPEEPGVYDRAYEVEIDDGNRVTDSAPWGFELLTVEEAPAGALALRVENVAGGSPEVPRSNGFVQLYDESDNLVAETSTDAVSDGTGAGIATFTGLDASTDYTAYVFNESDKSALNITEYWGRTSSISISSGSTARETFTRYMPYLVGLDVFDGSTNVTGQDVPVGTPLTVEVTVTNGGSAQTVEPRLILDRDRQPDGSGDYDVDLRGDRASVATGGEQTFTFEWTPQEPGEVYRTYVINTLFSSGPLPTGSGGWGGRSLVNVQEASPGALALRVENVAGGSTEVPRSNGVVQLYDARDNLVAETSTDAVGDDTGAGIATFTGLDASTDYTAYVFSESDKSALNITEYWGRTSSISISSGSTARETFTRYMPYLVGLDVFDGSTNVTGQDVPVGTPLTVEVTVTNGGSAQTVEPRLILDRDRQPNGSGDYDVDLRGDRASVATGGEQTFTFEWTPQEAGEVYRTYVINTLSSSGRRIATGSGGWWDGRPLVNVQAASPGTLALRVENVAGGSPEVPRSNGFVQLYDARDNLVAETSTDAAGDGTGAGIATFTGLDASTTYRAEIFNNPGSTTAFGSQEYWGKKTGLSVNSGATTDATFTRYMPYVLSVSVFDASGQEVTGASVEPGTELTARVEVQNDGGALSAAPRIVVDRDRTGGYDIDQTASGQSLPTGSPQTFEVTFTPPSIGNYYLAHETEITAGSLQGRITDGSAWSQQPVVQVQEASPGALALRVENVAGGSPEVPRSNGFVQLYDARDNLVAETSTDAAGDGTGAGIATFTGLDASTTYRAEIFNNPGSTTAFGSQEYWGKKTGLSVSTGTTTDATFTRYMPYVLSVRVFDASGQEVTGASVEPGTELTARVEVQNDGGALLAAPRIVVDRDRTSGYDIDQTASGQSLPTGSPQTFEVTFTPPSIGNYYLAHETEITAGSLQGRITDGSAWSQQPQITVGNPGSPPEVLATELEQHTPSSLYPRTYSIETQFTDADGTSDLRDVSLQIRHPSGATLGMKKSLPDGAEETTSGASHFSFGDAVVENVTDTAVKVTWTFTLNDSWPSANGGIEYLLGATDQGGQAATAVTGPVTASYKNYGTTVVTHGMQFPASNPLDGGLTAPDDRLSKWLMDMACRVKEKAGGGTVLVYRKSTGEFESPTSFSGSFHENVLNAYNDYEGCQGTSEGETILLFDWTVDSNDRGLGFSEAAADALYASLRMREASEGLGGLHLVGHSRGTAVMSEVTERLLSTNINIDQVTYLDPHDWGFPLEAIGLSPDYELAILPDNDVNEDLSIEFPSSTPVINGKKNNGVVGWSGRSLWMEAYYQTNGDRDAITTNRYKDGNCYYDDGGDLDGRQIQGAFSTNWTSEDEEYEEGEGDGECPLAHSGVVREYIRSVDGDSDAPGGYQYSRIGGFAHLRPDRTADGPTVEPRYDPENLGRGITNGDFERGNSCYSPLSASGARSGTVPGWSYHGGSTDATQLGIDYYGALVSTEEGQHLQLGGTVTKRTCNPRPADGVIPISLIPAGDVAVHNRFYIPENTSSISFTYHVQSPSSDDEIRVSLGDASGDNFQEKFSEVPDKRLTALRNVPVDGFAGTVATLKVELVRGNAVVGVDNFRINLDNAPPVASAPISNQTLTAGGTAFEANLSSVFSDPDDSALSFSASSSDDGIASASVSGETLAVTPLAAGTATITVEASDGTSDPGVTTFDVQVLETDQRPDPVITSIEAPPLQVELGESFTIQVTAENQGDPADYGSITFSFPQLNEAGDTEAVSPSSGSSSGDTPGYVEKAAGEEIFDRNTDSMTAQYLLVEYGDEDWTGSESNTLQVTVTPDELGTFEVYTRATFGINSEFVSTPATADATDQQQWPVEQFAIEVVEPTVAPPTDLTASAGESDVTLSWSASPDSDIEGYNVYRSTRPFGTPDDATQLNGALLSDLSYVDNSVTEGTSYIYRVAAVDADGTESVLSDAAEATVGSPNAAPDAVADSYAATAGQTLTVDAASGVLANDSDPDGDGLTASLVSDVASGTLTLNADGSFTYTANSGFTGEDAFTYAARDTNGGSAEANVTFTVEEAGATPPAAPTDLAATATGAQIDLSWTASPAEDVAGYHVYRAETSFSDPADATKLTSSLLTDVSYVDTDVTGGTTYVYRVTAVDATGNESALSAEASATPTESSSPAVPISEARQSGGETVTVEGTVTRAFGSHVRLQDASGATGASGIMIRQTSGPNASAFQAAVNDGTIQPGTILRVKGAVSFFAGLTQIADDALESYSVISQAAPPDPQPISLSDLGDATDTDPTGGDAFESELVSIANLTFTSSTGTFESGSNYEVTDGSSTLTLRVQGEDESALSGEPIPEGAFTFEGVIGQFHGFDYESAPNTGYQLVPIRPEDLVPAPDDTTPPAAPSDLSATADDSQVNLSWTASPEGDVAGYHVYRAETSFSDPANATKLTSSLLTDVSYVDTDVTGGTTYVYRVTATDGAGNESALSAKAQATLPAATVTRSATIASGWNLRSVPVETDDMTLDGTFASCQSAFRFTPGSGYASLGDAALSVGQGGFFNCSAGTVDLTGTPAASSVDVAAGWNIIGPQAEPVGVASITTEPAGLIESSFFGFAPDAGYAPAETLEPTFGYWVKVRAAGTIQMDGAAATASAATAAAAAAADGSPPTDLRRTDAPSGSQHRGSPHEGLPHDGSPQEAALQNAVRLVLTDAMGRRQTLYLDAALTEDGRSRFALPPVPPGGLFDVRFASGGTAETLSAPSGDRTAATTEATEPDAPALDASSPEAHRVDLQGVTFPVTVRVAGLAGQAEEAGGGRLRLEDPVHGHTLHLSEETPEAVLQGPTDRVLVGLEAAPEAYALGASYPNPASQRVTIEYALPEATEVTVEVYDLLGRRVLQAVGGQKAAGRHTVHLDAHRLPSGTYFYRMRAGDFTATKRLTIVR